MHILEKKRLPVRTLMVQQVDASADMHTAPSLESFPEFMLARKLCLQTCKAADIKLSLLENV